MGMGKIYLTRSSSRMRSSISREVLKVNPDNETMFLEVARAYYETNSPEDALGYYKARFD